MGPLEAEPPSLLELALLVEPPLPEEMASTEPDLPSTEPDLLSVLVVLTALATVVPTWRTPVPVEPSWPQVPTPPVGKSKADTVGGRSTIHTRPTNHAKTEEYAYI